MTQPATQPNIRVAAVVIRNPQGAVLCVRKKSSPRFQLPGGKLEAGESPLDAALRETLEEVGLNLDRHQLGLLGQFSAEASNEPGHTVTSTVFAAPADVLERMGAQPQPAAEIAEVDWIHPADTAGYELAPLLATRIFPALRPRALKAVTVFAGARDATDPATSELAYALGKALAEAGITLVYGGSKLGLMGQVAAGAHDAGGRTHGVLTTHLANYELKYDELDELELVGTMAERKTRMSELADGIIALPGGVGTLDELFDAWTSQQLGLNPIPIGLLGTEFWRPLATMVDHMVGQGFVRATDREHLLLDDAPVSLLTRFQTWIPPVPRWI